MKKLWLLLVLLMCSSAHGAVCGNNGTSASAPAGSFIGYVYSWPSCVLSVASTVQSCGVYWVLATGTGSCAIYATSAGAPTGAPICHSADTPLSGPLSQQTVTLTGCGTLAPGTYTIAWIISNGSSASIAQTSSGGIYGSISYVSYSEGSYPAFPSGASWTTPAGYDDGAVYLNVTAATAKVSTRSRGWR